MNDVLIVIGSGSRLYREYLLAAAAQRHPVWLLDAGEPSWQAPYLTGHTGSTCSTRPG